MESTFLERQDIQKEIKTEIVKKLVRSMVLYGGESWVKPEKHKTMMLQK